MQAARFVLTQRCVFLRDGYLKKQSGFDSCDRTLQQIPDPLPI